MKLSTLEEVPDIMRHIKPVKYIRLLCLMNHMLECVFSLIAISHK